MPDKFEFHNPVRLLFGEGTFGRLAECLPPLTRSVFLVTGKSAARQHGYLDQAVAMLHDAGTDVTVYDAIPPNPTDEIVDAGGALAREADCDLVVGLGGGSAMDAAKAIAVAATHEFPISEFLLPDERGSVRQPTDHTLPLVLVTTTAGTSSELTPFAVVSTPSGKEKSAIRATQLYARTSICDPELTHRVPPQTTAATGVDVLCHSVEAFISTNANPITDCAVERAIALVAANLPRAVADGLDREARARMSLANVFAGYGLSNAGVSMLHALEHPVSGHYPEVAHGEGLAALLVAYARHTWQGMPERFARVSELLGGPADAAAAADTFAGFLESVGLRPRLSHFSVPEDLLERLADDALRYMGGAVARTPGNVDRECLIRVLRDSY
jgi:alcohol dehydrogenase